MKFHNGLAKTIATICKELRKTTGLHNVVLSGGVWQNRYLLTKTSEILRANKFNCYHHKQIPTNDGGISLGQALIANAILKNRK